MNKTSEEFLEGKILFGKVKVSDALKSMHRFAAQESEKTFNASRERISHIYAVYTYDNYADYIDKTKTDKK